MRSHTSMKTFVQKPADVEKRWIVIDANGLVVGRLAAIIVTHLRGKHRPDFTPHVDSGDYVIVVNVEKVAFTGNKRKTHTYYWHTGYPGGIKERTAEKVLDGRFPERVLYKAVQRMLPDSKLARRQLGNLKLYAGPEHPHAAQKPEALDVGSLNVKNVKVN